MMTLSHWFVLSAINVRYWPLADTRTFRLRVRCRGNSCRASAQVEVKIIRA